MKKYIGFLIVLTFFVLGARETNAINIVNPPTEGCVTGPTAGLILKSLDVKTPADMIAIAGTNSVEVLRIDLSNIGTQNVCLNGIQLGSSSNLNNFITNTKVIDMNTGLQVGQIAYSFANNGSYYYSWVSANPSLSIKTGETKIFKVVSDFPITAQQGEFKIGSWGLNFDLPGASAGPQVVSGNLIKVVNSSTVTSSVTVLSPNGGEVYQAGQQITVKWDKSNFVGNVIIELQMPTIFGNPGYQLAPALNGGTPNDGQEVVTLPTVTAINTGWSIMKSGLYYKIRITDISHNPLDSSDNLFTINTNPFSSANDCTSVSAPSVTVLSPNGGEVYQAGQQIEVKWKSCNMPSNDLVDIAIQHHSPAGGGIGGANYAHNMTQLGVANDGIETVTLPTQYSGRPFGKNFKVIVIKHPYSTTNTVNDISDDTFTINSSSGDVVDSVSGSSVGSNLNSSTSTVYNPTFSSVIEIKRGAKSSEVKKIQLALKKLGYKLSTDGKFGLKTEDTIMKFQISKGLPITGVVDSSTKSSILSSAQ